MKIIEYEDCSKFLSNKVRVTHSWSIGFSSKMLMLGNHSCQKSYEGNQSQTTII